MGLGVLQHLLAGAIMLCVANITLNSYVSIQSMDGTKVYDVEPLNTTPQFEDSMVFQQIFETAVYDITRLVVIKGQLETDGVFDPNKVVDVTEFANRGNDTVNCSVTAKFNLDDLIKWGKYGAEYNMRTMSLSEFIGYFGDVIWPENFGINEYDQLVFKGFYKVGADETEEVALEIDEDDKRTRAMMEMYGREQLEDMVFSYIMANTSADVTIAREDDGVLTVSIPMLDCRYETVDKVDLLTSYASNWVDYLALQQNLVKSIETLQDYYKKYTNCNETYTAENSNLKYAVRMMTNDGMRTFTNMENMENAEDIAVTEYFAELRRYLIYYPDNMEFLGNVGVSEQEIFAMINEYEYAYPETTHIWIGVDTSYAVEGDAFYDANQIFTSLVPHMGKLVGTIVVLVLAWIGLCVYLTHTTGVTENKEGKKILYLRTIDHVWTEVIVIVGIIMLCGVVWAARFLAQMTETVYADDVYPLAVQLANHYGYAVFALFGCLASWLFNTWWYSLARRAKSGTFWVQSLAYQIYKLASRIVTFVVRNRNSVISALIPYNLYLLVNMFLLYVIYTFKEQQEVAFLLIVVVVLFDGYVGMLMFKRRAERMDILDGLSRIKDGDVEYQLDVDALHGFNKDMASAVNNIGDGIRKAVETSMKDERMKTDLITNVSHDIKTPLTSIISYVDLLKRQNIQQEPAKTYIEILENKSLRLKQLTDDLVEASKISSGNIILNMEKLNLTELVNQSIGEFVEKLEEKQLQLVFPDETKPAYIYADSRRMWRVIENLFNNIYKYALEGTRVYIDLVVADGSIALSLKNISARQMNIRPDELTERFIRGDSARSTEGSGLGLSIAKSLTQAQGGEFRIYLDGDLFKVVLVFPEYSEDLVKQPTENNDK